MEKIDTRFQTYSSFYIPSESIVREALMDASIWPRGFFVKRYFS